MLKKEKRYLLVATAIALFDNFPSERNLARLEFLEQPVYFIYRTMSLDALIVVFGLMFLMSNRFSLDNTIQPHFLQQRVAGFHSRKNRH